MNLASQPQATTSKAYNLPHEILNAHQRQARYPGHVPLDETLMSFQICTSADPMLPMGM